MSRIRSIAIAAAVATVSLFGASRADAGFTAVSPTPFGSERDVAEILEHVYGPSVTATRVDDNDDSLFSGIVTSIKALARFAGNSQNFGTFDGTTFTSLMNTTGTGYGIVGEVTTPIVLADGTAFARKGGGTTVSTNAAYNSDGLDHAVTYQLTGDEFATPTYVLFFEDLIGGGDRDYNDLAVELTFAAAPGNPVAVPLPGALLMGIATLAGGTIFRKRIAKSIA